MGAQALAEGPQLLGKGGCAGADDRAHTVDLGVVLADPGGVDVAAAAVEEEGGAAWTQDLLGDEARLAGVLGCYLKVVALEGGGVAAVADGGGDVLALGGVGGEDFQAGIDGPIGMAPVLGDALQMGDAVLEDGLLGLAGGYLDGAGDQAGDGFDHHRLAGAADAGGPGVGVGGRDHDVRGRYSWPAGDELAGPLGQAPPDADQVADHEGDPLVPLFQHQGAGVERVMDAQGDILAAAVAVEGGADRRSDIDRGGAGFHGRAASPADSGRASMRASRARPRGDSS